MSLGLNILLIFVFLLLGSVFAGTELALVSLRGSQTTRWNRRTPEVSACEDRP